jgi:hypothetical protein
VGLSICVVKNPSLRIKRPEDTVQSELRTLRTADIQKISKTKPLNLKILIKNLVGMLKVPTNEKKNKRMKKVPENTKTFNKIKD